MKIFSALPFHVLVVALLLALSSCSQHNVSSSRSGGLDAEEQDEFEANLNEELDGLNRLHSWKAKRSAQQLRMSGIDPADYDFPIVLNDQVQYYLDLFQGKQRKSFQRQLERSSIYMAGIKKELQKAGLPQDLAYLAMIESGYNPTICSHAKACGMWQFIESTGRNYNLTIDPWIDERREPEKATRAAIRYLAKLYGDFNDWHLAVAAYNAGENRIARAIDTHGTKDFWEIAESDSIYLETKRYVPKLIATIIIARHPAKYGFTELNYMRPVQHDLVHVPGGTALQAVSVSSGTPVEDLRGLNTELLKNQIPPGKNRYPLRVPLGKKDLVTANLHRVHPISKVSYLKHTVRKGENINTICNRYGISRQSLLSANKIRSSRLKNGTSLQIPSKTTKYVLLQEGERLEDLIARHSPPPRNENRKRARAYRVQSGDTLYRIAKKHGVSVQDLKNWNNLADHASIRVGQEIAVGHASLPEQESSSALGARIAMAPAAARSPEPFIDRRIDEAVARVGQSIASRQEPQRPPTRAGQARLAMAAGSRSPAQLQELNAQRPAPTAVNADMPSPGRSKKPAAIAHNANAKPVASVNKPSARTSPAPSTWYVVQNGDSLWTIARKFQITPQDLRQWNQLSSNDLRTGNRLIVKKS